MTNPVAAPDLFNRYTLAGVRSPGVVTFSGLANKVKFDVKEGQGQDDATTTRKGRVPVEFSASHHLVLDPTTGLDEFAQWDAFLPLLEEAQKGEKAFDLYHPDVERCRIKSVVVTEIGGLAHDGKGGATVVVKFQPWAPPKPKPASAVAGSKTTTGKAPNAPDPNLGAKLELETLLIVANFPDP